MFRIALVDMFSNGSNGSNYGHLCISASLKRAAFEVYNIFGRNNLRNTPEIPNPQLLAFDKLVKEIKPDLVGFSITSILSYSFAAKMAARIKSFSNIPIIFGGAYPSIDPEFSIANANIDYVCVGEADESIVELCQRLSQGSSGDGIPGVMSKKRSTFIRRDPPKNLDTLPFQDIASDKIYSILLDGRIINRNINSSLCWYVTRCSRGSCPFSCTFCNNEQLRNLYKPGEYFRQRSPQNVIEELRRYLKINSKCRFIFFYDEIFYFNNQWTKEFSAQYKKHINLPFYIWLHPKMIKEEKIMLLKSAGLWGVILGIESASEETRKNVYGRGETQEDILKADRLFSKYKVNKTYDFIIDHPWESATELRDTFDLLIQINRPLRINMHSLVILPNTKLEKRAIKEGLLKEGEAAKRIVDAPVDISRKFQWFRADSHRLGLARDYWVFLIFLTAIPVFPKWLLKLLSRHTITNNRHVVKTLLFVFRKLSLVKLTLEPIRLWFIEKRLQRVGNALNSQRSYIKDTLKRAL
ncbi:B12-binding domain-containing radical SAM protein [Candidatus Omnitrophota bacterium]